MKIIPILLLSVLIIPKSIVDIPIFPFGLAYAHPINVRILNETQHSNDTASSAEIDINGQNSLECDACVFLANGINHTVIHNPKVVSFVTTDIEEICQVLPSSVQQLCLSAAQQAVPNLLNHLGDFIVTEGCSDLGICHNKYS